jgi:hypothetical protein
MEDAKDMQRIPPTTETVSRNILGETVVWILSDENEKGRHAALRTHTSAEECAAVRARKFRFALKRIADREHRPLIRIGSV